ncbi:MAG: Mur ligase family protein, partial [bacterium]|nr:Mur ligase family protein [bacterium]
MDRFRNKNVVVMGLGLHGGGLAAAKWFYKHGAHVIVTDMKSAHELRASVEKLYDFCDEYASTHPSEKFIPVTYVLGEHRLDDFKDADLVIQNPGVPRESEYLAAARQAQVPIENEVTLFFLLTPKTKKIGVTGTKGKSTTTMIIYEILKRVYSDTQVVGVATPQGSVGFFEILDEVLERETEGKPVYVVMELSSWQLELLEYHSFSPQIAVVTNVMRDHLNRYS